MGAEPGNKTPGPDPAMTGSITDPAGVLPAEMDIQCPDCGAVLRVQASSTLFPCPGCQRELEITFADCGLVLVGTSGKKPEQASRSMLPPDDPVLEDLGKWQTGAVFAILAGSAGAVVIGLSIMRDLSAHGVSFFTRTQNWIIPLTLSAAALLCIAGGVWALNAIRKERQKYEVYIQNKFADRTRHPIDGHNPGG